jgi:hypothetical protein
MHSLLFRSRELILQSDEADLVRDVCFNIDKAQTKLKAIRRRLQGLQEYTTAELHEPAGTASGFCRSGFEPNSATND